MKDRERGVVWEETIIFLEHEIKMVSIDWAMDCRQDAMGGDALSGAGAGAGKRCVVWEETIIFLEHEIKMVRAGVTGDGGDGDGREVWWVEKTTILL